MASQARCWARSSSDRAGGTFTGASGAGGYRAYIANPSNGSYIYTHIDGLANMLEVTGINNAGQIVGEYDTNDYHIGGFVGSPSGGTYTYYVNGVMEAGQDALDAFLREAMRATFFPG